MKVLALLLVSSVLTSISSSPTYSCYGENNNKGVCKSIGYPSYNYTVFVDYTDMSLKVYATSLGFPSYSCGIYGWLTPEELTLQCVAERESTTIPQIPHILYCSAGRSVAICVDE